MNKISLLLLVFFCATTAVSAQNKAIRVNTLSLATATLNAGVDIGVSQKWSVDGTIMWNPVLNNSSAISIGAKRWRFEPNVGWFWGVHSTGARYNMNRREGYSVGIGSSVGYSWILSKRWSLSLEGGIGFFYMKDRQLVPEMSTTEDIVYRHRKQVVVAPSRLEVGFSYLF